MVLSTAPRVDGSNLSLSLSFISCKKNCKTTKGSRHEESKKCPEEFRKWHVAQERREEKDEPAGEPGTKHTNEGDGSNEQSLIKWSTPSNEECREKNRKVAACLLQYTEYRTTEYNE